MKNANKLTRLDPIIDFHKHFITSLMKRMASDKKRHEMLLWVNQIYAVNKKMWRQKLQEAQILKLLV